MQKAGFLITRLISLTYFGTLANTTDLDQMLPDASSDILVMNSKDANVQTDLFFRCFGLLALSRFSRYK